MELYTVVTVGASTVQKTDYILTQPDAYCSAEERAIRAAIANNTDTPGVVFVNSQRTAAQFAATSGYAAEALDGTVDGYGDTFLFLVSTTRMDGTLIIWLVYAKQHARDDGAVAWNSGTSYVTGNTALANPGDGDHTYRALNSNTNQDPVGAGSAHWVQDDAAPAEWARHMCVYTANPPNWDSGTTYNTGDPVFEYGFGYYTSKIDTNLNHTPHSSGTQWLQVVGPVGQAVLPIGTGPVTVVI